jgi:hypothetical protein
MSQESRDSQIVQLGADAADWRTEHGQDDKVMEASESLGELILKGVSLGIPASVVFMLVFGWRPLE